MLRRKFCLVVLSGLLLMALSSAAWASTQFGVGVTNLVTLVSSYDTNKGTMDFYRLKRDATTESSYFRIKSGNYLVVTDVDFLITGVTDYQGQFVTLDILIVKTANKDKFTVPFSRSLRLDSEGNGSANITLNAGFVSDSNARPGAEIFVNGVLHPELLESNVQIILHGYLTS